MAKFLNKKEQVYDLKLTSYGRYLLGEGSFKPTYYAFFDDSILYDSDYARYADHEDGDLSGSKEVQNNIHKRIKEETQYLESLVLFEDVDNNRLLDTQTYNEAEGHFESEFNPTKAELLFCWIHHILAVGHAIILFASAVRNMIIEEPIF